MFILDTNVVSELMRADVDPTVLGWIDRRLRRQLFTTAITEAEIRVGIACLPAGARRRGLADACERAFGDLLANRVLPFDSGAARSYAEIVTAKHRTGRLVSQADGQILAIAQYRRMTVATRNVKDFEDAGVEIVNPWSVGA